LLTYLCEFISLRRFQVADHLEFLPKHPEWPALVLKIREDYNEIAQKEYRHKMSSYGVGHKSWMGG
jgi:hypothetical protein